MRIIRGMVLATLMLSVVAAGAWLSSRNEDAAFAQSGCSGPRWSVKTLSDPDAAQGDFTPVTLDVADLVALPGPRRATVLRVEDLRIVTVELTTYTLTARLLGARLMPDGDLRLVLSDRDDPEDTMVAELPEAINCPVVTPPELRARMAAAREAYLAAFGTPPTDEQAPLDARLEITGVGFFGPGGRLPGIAANHVELHPVLELRALP